jgi:hypothetical protein
MWVLLTVGLLEWSVQDIKKAHETTVTVKLKLFKPTTWRRIPDIICIKIWLAMRVTENKYFNHIKLRWGLEVGIIVVNTTFNNISVISWRSVLLLGKPEYSETSTDLAQVYDKLYHMLYRVHLVWAWFELTTALIARVVINPTTIRSGSWRPLKLRWHKWNVQIFIFKSIRDRSSFLLLFFRNVY